MMADGVKPGPGAEAAAIGLERFYRGRLLRVHHGAGTGIVLSESGRELPFTAAHVRVLGSERGFAALSEGAAVGFDVGRTARGLQVTVIRVFEAGGDRSRP